MFKNLYLKFIFFHGIVFTLLLWNNGSIASPVPVHSNVQVTSPDELSEAQPSWPNPFDSMSFSSLIGTPSFQQTSYDKRLQGFGNFFLFSVPLFEITDHVHIHSELGPGFSFSKTSSPGSNQKQRHLYMTLPARFRAIYSLSRKLHVEGFLGMVLRPVEYFPGSDSRTEWFKSPQWITPDGGLGLDYHLTPPLKTRVLLGYSFFSAGLELTW